MQSTTELMTDKTSYLRLCEKCDLLPQYPESCYQLRIQGFQGAFGHIIETVVQKIAWNDKQWEVNHAEKYVKLLGQTSEDRQTGIDGMLDNERKRNTFRVLRKWRGERFAIYGPAQQIIVTFERSASPLLGIVSYGVQLIVYQDTPEGLSFWTAKRAATKMLYPNMFTVTVGGSLPANESPFECLVRESDEEASIPAHLIRENAKAVGTISYVTETDSKMTSGGEAGLISAEIQFIYEMKVGPEFYPQCNDDEVDSFHLYSIDELKQAIDDGEFCPSDSCYYLDFFIRHGLTTFEDEPNYTQIITRMHRSLGVQTR